MKSIAIFNNKGGVGKTTYLFHIAHLLADRGKKVLMVDCDSQCNLSSYSVSDQTIYQSWNKNQNSIFRILDQVHDGVGDIRKRKPISINENLLLIPGDIDLSIFEDKLGETWGSAQTQTSSLRIQIAIYRYVSWVVETNKVDYVLYDLGPNLGAINRAVLGGCDYFITPLSPDLFSIKGTENLGKKFIKWSKEWERIIQEWQNEELSLLLPKAKPKFVGYVLQQHNIRLNSSGMTKGWQLFGNKVNDAVNQNIVAKLKEINQVVERSDYKIGAIPNLHSLIPYSLAAKKPVYKCTSKDGLNGEHINRARDSREYYDDIIEVIENLDDYDIEHFA